MILFRKLTFYLALIGIFVAVQLVIRLAAREPTPPPPATPPENPYKAAVAASGIVEASGENTQIGVPVPGLITSIHVKVWDRVEAGQPLLQLDDRDLRASLLTQNATIAVAEATLQRLRDQLARLESVSDPRAISQEELKTRQNDVAVAMAQLGAAKATVAQTHALLERLTVRAPLAATVLQVNNRAGEYVTNQPMASTASVSKACIVLGSIDTLQVRADVDEQLAPRVRQNMRATASLKGDAAHPFPLEFVRIEPFIVPKVSLTGASTERVDTRVLQLIYRFKQDPARPVYVGQQLDIYMEEGTSTATAK
ncbi:MAG: efflux RND transporter periplasmic adaptor subunit [Verrucomicrobiota bacterium]|nr:efflux RND transporter periplasmic adaptor subunit [Verrucomicrobiota bacterium]